MPGYTHLQRAQPVYLSHHLLAYSGSCSATARASRLAAQAADDLPLGAGALAGVNFDTDRRSSPRSSASAGWPNSLDAVSNRDFVLDYLSAAATCATHLSQLGAEIVLWSSEEFGFCEVSDAWASGSSIMPQKKNPDAAELLRAKAPRVVGHLAALHGVLHALPLTYNKDLQEDKEHLFDAVDTVELCRAWPTGMLRSSTFRRERMAAAPDECPAAATDVADHLVRRGVPVPGVARHSGRAGAQGARAGPAAVRARARASSPRLRDEVLGLAGGVARVQGLGGRHRAGPGARAARAGPGGSQRAPR